MTLLTIRSPFSKGGLGRGAWAALITGQSQRHGGLARAFVKQDAYQEPHSSRGWIDLLVEEPGVYELRGVNGFLSQGECFSGYIKVAADGTHTLLGTRQRLLASEVLAAVDKPIPSSV
jgi:hypothetical protein